MGLAEGIGLAIMAAGAGSTAYHQKRQRDKQERMLDQQEQQAREEAERQREQLAALEDARNPNNQDQERRRKALASGRTNTILTSPMGASGSAQTQRKTLLGQ